MPCWSWARCCLPLLAVVAWQGARRTPEVAWLAAALGAIGFIGVARWVSYPFVPARMLFVLPFFLLLVAAGRGSRPLGQPGGRRHAAALAVRHLVLLPEDRLSQQAVPHAHPGDRRPDSARFPAPADSAILVDSTNSDPIALLYALSANAPFCRPACRRPRPS